MISFIRWSLGATTGTVNMVLAMVISRSAVQVSLVMICLSSRMLPLPFAGTANKDRAARQVPLPNVVEKLEC